jgi:hypothetical protein
VVTKVCIYVYICLYVSISISISIYIYYMYMQVHALMFPSLPCFMTKSPVSCVPRQPCMCIDSRSLFGHLLGLFCLYDKEPCVMCASVTM